MMMTSMVIGTSLTCSSFPQSERDHDHDHDHDDDDDDDDYDKYGDRSRRTSELISLVQASLNLYMMMMMIMIMITTMMMMMMMMTSMVINRGGPRNFPCLFKLPSI